MPGLVLVLEDDLPFSARLENALRFIGYQPRPLTRPEHVGEALNALPVLALVNVGSPAIAWKELVRLTKARRPIPPPQVVGYGPHVDSALRQQALASGCDAVVGRSAVANNLDSILKRYVWKPDRLVCQQIPPGGVLKGIKQFNSRAFYRCHDSIEAVWANEQSDARFLYQGLLQIGVAFYHIQRGNLRGAAKMVARGRGKLLPFLPDCQGIDLTELLAAVDRCETALHEADAHWLASEDWFPTIRFSG